MTLPTGGAISFTYQNFKDGRGTTNRWLSSRSQGGGTWTYSPAANCGSACQTVTVTTPAANQTVYQFALNLGFGAWATNITYYNGSVGGTPALTLQNQYSTLTTDPNLGSNAFTQLQSRTITIPGPSGNLVKTITYAYDRRLTYSFNGNTYIGSRGQLGSVTEYAFNSTTAPYRTKVISFLDPDPAGTSSEVDWYTSRSDMVNDILTFDSSNILRAETKTSYDDFPVTPVSTAVEQHDATSANLNRGNPTTIQSLISGSSYTKTTLQYDNTGQVLQLTDPNSNTYSFSYSDNFAYDSSPAQNPPSPLASSPYTYPNPTNAYLTKVTLPIIGPETMSYYWGSGKPASSADQNGADTYSHYLDSLDRPTHTFLPDGGWSLLSYAPGGVQVDSYSGIIASAPTTSCPSSAASCMHTTQLADSLGRPNESILASDPDGTTYTTTSYDALDRPQTTSNPYRTSSDSTYGFTTVSYDTLSRPTVAYEPDGSTVYAYYGANVTGAGGLSSQLCAPATYGYGYPKLTVDEAGNKLQVWADAFGHTIEVDEPNTSGALSVQTCYTYDALDNLTGVYQTGGTSDQTQWRVRTYTYDSLSRLASETEPETGTTTYTYDNNGNVLTQTAPAPNQTGTATVTTTYQYDALNRLTQKSYSDGTTPAVTYVYDAATTTACTLPTLTISNGVGRRTGMCDAAGAESWAYDPMGRPRVDQRMTGANCGLRCGSTITDATTYSYNLDGSIATLTYPTGRTITYTASAAGRQLSAIDVTNNISFASNAHYAPTGDLVSVQNGAAIVSTHIFNSRMQLCWAYTTNSTPLPWNTAACAATTTPGSVLDLKYNLSLGLADNGNIIGIANNRDNTRSQNFTYDPLYRIATAQTQTTGVTIPNSNCWGLTFGYDPWGNLLQSSMSGPSGCGEPIPLNVSVTAANQMVGYSYDAAGNLLNDGANPYSYNPESQLATAGPITTTPTHWTAYSYDGDNQRILKKHYAAGWLCGLRCTRKVGVGSMTVYWRSLSGDVLAETDDLGNIVDGYVFFNGARSARFDSSNNVDYYFADHLGTSRVVTDSSGNILDDSDFYPFGVERPVTSSSGNTYKFTGYERDAESGLDYASTRHFSSILGRFMSPDPLSGYPGNPQSWNRYAYVQNNPLNATDPSGMCSEDDGYTGCDSGDSGWDPSGLPDATAYLTYIAPMYWSSMSYDDLQGYLNYSYGDPLAAGPNFQTGGYYPNDGSILSQIMNNPTTAAQWTRTFNSASDWVDAATTYTVMQGTTVFGAAVPIIGKTLYYVHLATLAPAANYQGYFGYDAAGNIRYVGITGRDPAIRFGEHADAIGTGRESLRYRVVNGAQFPEKEGARVWEQRMLLRYGMQKNGGQLLNLRNEISPKYWKLFQIFEELE